MQYMSQVIRKYSNGKPIKLDDSQLFQREGFGAYKREDIANNLAKGLEQFIADEKMNEKDAQIFRQIVGQAIEGTRNGQFTKMDTSGIHNTMNWNSSGVTEGKKFLGINVGGQRAFDKSAKTNDGRNNALNALNRFYTKTLDSMSTYNYDDELKAYNDKNPKSKFNANEFLTKEISKKWYGGNDIDFNNWFKNRAENDRNALLGEIFNNADYNKLYQDYDWTDTGVISAEDLANKFKGFGSAIANNKLDNDDYNRFAELGGSGLDKFMKETKEVQEPTTEQTKLKTWEDETRAAGATSPEAISAYVQGKQREEADRNAAIIKANEQDIYNRERDKYFEDFISQNPFKGTISGYVASKTTYNPESVLQYVDSKYKGTINDYLTAALDPRYFRGQLTHNNAQGQENLSEHLANNLDLAINTGKLPKIDDETYAIPGTYNYDNWSLITYNPSTRQYKETSMLANDALKKIAYAEYDRRKKVPSNKEGGIIKLQYGGFVEDDSVYNAYKKQFAKKKEEQKQQVAAKAEATKRTPKQVEAGGRKPMAEGQDWEYEDYARLISAGADVGSMIASFVPGYGTAASAGLGLGSTIGNFTADLADESVSLRSAFGNAALGLGMDVVGLIPGLGAAGKGSKIVKNLLKVAPKLMTVWSASTSFAPAIQAFNKLRDKGASEMTVDDWRALANGLTAAAGTTRWGASAARNKILTHKYGTPTRTVTTKSGKQVQMSEDEFQRIKRASGIEGQNEALKAVKGAKNEELPTTFKSWYNPKRIWQGTPEASKNTVINTDAMKRVAPDGTVLVPTKYSNEGIWRGAVNNSWGAKWKGWKGWKGPDWLKNWGYAPETPKGKPTSNTPKPKKELLALPAPNQVHRTPNREYINVDISRDLGRSNLTGKGVITSSTPVESPDAGIIRTVNAVSSILQPFTNRLKNLPAVIPASRNAEKVVASRTIQPTKRLDQFIEDQIPGGLVYGRARAEREKEYKDIFQPAAEAEYNKVWDDMYGIKNGWMLPQAVSNERVANITMRGLINERQAARNASENVNRQIAMAVAEQVPKRPTRAEHNKRQGQLEATFNQKKYDMEEALRTRELPHKKSNKKKKTSKDNKVKRREFGGLLFKDGGLIPKFEFPAGPIRMQAKSKNYFNRNTGLSDYDFGADIDTFLKQGSLEDYVIGFNGREDNYDALVKASGGTYGNRNYISDPLATTVQSGMLTYNPGFDKYIRQNIQGYGVTEGQGTGTDTYLGDRTWERTLGRNITPEQAKYYNDTYLRQRGIEMYDKGDGGYRLRLLSSSPVTTSNKPISTNTPTGSSTTSSNTGNGVVGTSNPTAKDSKKNFSLYPEDVLSLGRMIGGLVTNNRIAKLYKQGLKPTLIDTFENTIPLQGNFLAKSNAEQQASNLQSMAAKPRTSDASLQLAGELEASNKAGQARFQGGLQDAEMFYKTRMLGQQESDAAKARRVEVANKNRAAINAIDAAKKQIDAGRVTANYQQVLAPWLAGIENKYAQNRAMLKQYDLENSMNNQNTAYQTELAQLYNKYKDNIPEFTTQKQLLDNKYKQLILDKKKSLISSPWLINFAKSGSKLGYKEKAMLQRAKDFNKRLADDNKQFHKDIMESKREHNKLIMNMSALTAALIKKGMQL